jgi:hypothetical protein
MAEQSRSEQDPVRQRRRGAGGTGGAAAAAPAEPGADPEQQTPEKSGKAAKPLGKAAQRKKEADAERRRRRALFLRELAEARELRARVQPRRTKERRLREALRMRTFRG